MEQILLRPAEAADAIGVSRSKIYELISSGQIPSVRLGTSVRVPVDALREMIARRLALGQPSDQPQRYADVLTSARG